MPTRETLRASGRAVTLALPVEELRTLLADNTDLVSGLFATLAGQAAAAGGGAVEPATATDEFERVAAGGVLPVEKIVILERVPLLAGLSADEARHVAEIARTVPLKAGALLFADSATPAIWIVLSGEIALEGAEPLVASAGGVVGALATLSGRPLGRAARVVKEGVALRIGREDLFDLLAERPALLRQLFAGIFRMAGPQPELT